MQLSAQEKRIAHVVYVLYCDALLSEMTGLKVMTPSCPSRDPVQSAVVSLYSQLFASVLLSLSEGQQYLTDRTVLSSSSTRAQVWTLTSTIFCNGLSDGFYLFSLDTCLTCFSVT
jgi:hypothetical protein